MTTYKPAEAERLVREMPTITPRRPYDGDSLPGYDESFNDWAGNNQDAVEWLLDNGRAMADQLEAARQEIERAEGLHIAALTRIRSEADSLRDLVADLEALLAMTPEQRAELERIERGEPVESVPIEE